MGRSPLIAGGAWRDITPPGSFFLYGYPHAERNSSGVHDPLLASALYLQDGTSQVVLVQVDVIWLSKVQVGDARRRISERTGIAAEHIMVSASHTHSGPATVPMLSNADDPVVPPPDPTFVERLVAGIADAAACAVHAAVAAEIAIEFAEMPNIGGNRLDPAGPRALDVPVIALRSAADHGQWIGMMFVNPVHPTVLHEDSTLISGDLPAMCRKHLRERLLGAQCPVLCPLGAAGNQSPRHVIRVHTFDEAKRLGSLLGESIERALSSAKFSKHLQVRCQSTIAELLPRQLPTIAEAELALKQAADNLTVLRRSDEARAAIRSAECAVFGAEETVALAKAAASGELHQAQHSCLPAEIQLIYLDDCPIVGWPGEIFIEFALLVKERYPKSIIVSLANGELQGYLVTKDAVEQRCYEAGNAVFASPISGTRLVDATLALLSKATAAKSY